MNTNHNPFAPVSDRVPARRIVIPGVWEGYPGTDSSWKELGACNGIPGPFDGTPNKETRKVCRACPVRAACREAGIVRYEPAAIWGGLSSRQVRAIARARIITAEGQAPPDEIQEDIAA